MTNQLSIAFVWHMHQPYYRDLVTGECSMPWVRLHAAKDYVDMVKVLEPFPAIHQTFNVVPSLLDQLEDYLPPAKRSDRFLDLSSKPAAALSAEDRQFILKWFFLAHPERMIKPYPRYHDLLAKRGLHVAEGEWPAVQKRFKLQDYLDLQVWFNLAWIDPWLRSQDARLSSLVGKGGHFTEEDKSYVLERHLSLVAAVVPTYREAAARGQIELTTSPYYHPILPLLCDGKAAHMALPHLTLPPQVFRHPEDAQWQLEQGLTRHAHAFGQRPQGMWPSEGSVSEEVAKLVIEAHVKWIATDEEILWRTLKTSRSLSLLYRPHVMRRKQGQVAIVFRDRELSDLIGFVYSQWDPPAAVTDFMKRLEHIHQQFREGPPALISIILDGENAWEFYPNDGHDFLTTLYHALSQDERFRCVTINEFLQQHPVDHAESLPELFSGSWIDGNFATWIGHPEKNQAWRELLQAREAFAHLDRKSPSSQQAWQSLGIAEGSDWMWWFGDTHFSAQADEFDRLFRLHLINAYRLAGVEPPASLQQPIRHPVLRTLYEPTAPIHPSIDGRETSYFEWLYAGKIELRKQYAAMHRGGQAVSTIAYGSDGQQLYCRFDFHQDMLASYAPWSLLLEVGPQAQVRVTSHPRVQASVDSQELPCAMEQVLELAIPLSLLRIPQGRRCRFALSVLKDAQVVERYPEQGVFELTIAAGELDAHAWSV